VVSRALGVQASVYNVNAKNWIALSESVEDIERFRKVKRRHWLRSPSGSVDEKDDEMTH
jgi:hypothetical protein